MSKRYVNEEAWLQAVINAESEEMDTSTSSEEEGVESGITLILNKNNEPGFDQLEGSQEIGKEENVGEVNNDPILSPSMMNKITQSINLMRNYQPAKWYHFDEEKMSWLPVHSRLQNTFDVEYIRVRDNPSLRELSPHFTFEMNGMLYGVRIDYDDIRGPYGEQFKLEDNRISRTIIKAIPDSLNCINGLPVLD